MKVTAALKKELAKWLDTYWTTYLKGDIRKWSTFIRDDYKNIGGTKEEIWNSKQEIIDYTYQILDQLKGSVDIRNRKVDVIPYGEYLMVHEFTDIYIKVDKEWTFYGPFRMSTLLEKTKTGWIALHQHGSYPDMKALEGEAFSLDALKAENARLQEAVKNRTFELEIETALERVRAVAMSMQKQEDLSIIGKTIFTELKKLGFTGLRNTEMVINNDAKETIRTYHYSDYGQEEILEIPYKENPVVKKWAKDLKKAKNTFVPVTIPEKQIAAWKAYRKKLGYKNDPKMARAKTVYYYSYSTGSGALSISTWEPLPKEQVKILERFRNLFNLSYQRYTDIARAEAQAKEAQIEAALERVRSRSLAMHNTSELQEVIHTVHQELIQLGIGIHGGSFIAINADCEKELRCWGSGGTADTSAEVTIPYYDKPFYTNLLNRIKKGPGFFTEAYTQKEKKDFFTFLFRHEPWSKLKAKEKKEVLSAPGGYTRSCAVSKLTSIFIINHFGKLYSDEENDILKRFAKVFEQAYTRFLDLQKAEAQAKEAQIEAALERVRSRSMAMHNSSEIGEVALVLFQQLKSLGGELWGTGFAFCKVNSTDDEFWFANEKGIMPHLKIPNNVDPAHKQMYKGWKNKLELLSIENGGKELKDHYKYMLTVPDVKPIFQGMLDQGITFPKWQKWHAAYFKYGYMLVITTEPYEKEKVFIRFAKVFEQAYTRFLDLQKAEAQAREAEIELGLERVRARAMAMQKSNELSDLVDTVFKELTKLDFALNWCIINIIDEPSLTNMVWAANPETNKPPESYLMKFEDYPFHHSMLKGYQQRKTKHVYVIEGKEKKTYDDYLFNKTEWRRIPKAAQAASRAMKRYVATFTFSNFGGLQTVGEEYLSEENLDILSRFGKVFDLTYTRFNDLLKAEAQAREAQIEVALERIRNQSMLMQHSHEIQDLSKIFHEQLLELQIPSEFSYIWLPDEKKEEHMFWATWTENTKESSVTKSKSIVYPLDKKEPYTAACFKAWKSKTPVHIHKIPAKETAQFFETWKELLKGARKIKARYFPDGLFYAESYMKYGCFGINIRRQLDAEEQHILYRFTVEFERAYTRFLDLQKAEAQAREANIEAALERVRARSMAMHESTELVEASDVMLTELKKLNIQALRIGICTIDKETEASEIWSRSEINGKVEKTILGVVPKGVHPIFDNMVKAWKEKQPAFFSTRTGKEVKKYYQALSPYLTYPIPETFNEQEALSAFFLPEGSLNVVSHEPLHKEEEQIMLRFAKEFGQVYRRFLDLQKAEAQAREAQIEVAVERVRAQSMAMHHPDDLDKVNKEILAQLKWLQIQGLSGVTFYLVDKNGLVKAWDFSSPGNIGDQTSYKFQFDFNKYEMLGFPFKILLQTDQDYFIADYPIEKLEKALIEIEEIDPTVARVFKEALSTGVLTHQWSACVRISNGMLAIDLVNPPDEDTKAIGLKMAGAFNQAYTRFLDLQKAEARAREAQIEASLERIRAKAMAMHQSEELDEVLAVLCEQFDTLGIFPMSTHMTVLDIDNNKFTFRETGKFGNRSFGEQTVALDAMDTWKDMVESWKTADPYSINSLHFPKETLPQVWEVFHESFDSMPEGSKITPDDYPDGIYHTAGKHPFGYIGMNQVRKATREEEQIVIKFANEFGRAYQRFLDLQKAEAQAREAKIEAALEKIRSRTMAMQTGDEVKDVVVLLYKELMALGVTNFVTCGYVEINEKTGRQLTWVTSPGGDSLGLFYLPLTGDATFDERYNAWKKQQAVFHQTVAGEERSQHLAYATTTFNSKEAEEMVLSQFPDPTVFYCFNFSHGYLHIVTGSLLKEEEEILMARFTRVFEQTYARFLDLQKAEAQAREAQIEAALERVRSQSMGMQTSKDLSNVTSAMFEQLRMLGSELYATGIVFCDRQKDEVEQWHSVPDAGMLTPFIVPVDLDYIHRYRYDQWKKGTELFSIEIPEDFIEQHFNTMFDLPSVKAVLDDFATRNIPMPETPSWEIDYGASFKYGYILISALKPLQETYILPRFAKVFEQTYTRFLDLKNAEALAHKAKIEVALERVRARALAMQEPEELKDVAQVLRTEMGLLGVEELETCSIYINDEHTEKAECWYALKDLRSDEKKLVNDHFALNLNDTWVGREMLKFYHSEDKQTSILMTGDNRIEWIRMCEEKSAPFRGYYGAVIPDRTYHLYKFSHGAIGAAAAGNISAESWDLLRRAASVFSLAYSRFKDLTQARIDLEKLKTEKQRAEEALTNLKAAQSQLVQAEKMASLGELTAGIAHEIQNPLNFVNNFSEVSNELLDELLEAADKGDFDDVKEILFDVKQNLDKINHHGKRADAIVKGMLQHSRSSSGTKEPTDLNALTDEYLRLAYHGLRAKDKSFNARLKTDYYEKLDKVNIIPQDIGRVILNLITNAFYVVHEKKKSGITGYEPAVIVSTRSINGNVEVVVRDNGNGIPQKVLDKIFQPFFTTKPTGQGTGLGLSLAYDIVKSHGGNILVETKEGEGSEFIISLPVV